MSDACSGCDGLCCYDVIVRVTGYDAWRIKQAQALEYEQFVTANQDDPTGVGAFLLPDGYHALFLAKNAQQPRACAFLMHFPDETRRCSIYAERPKVCQVYPMSLRGGTVDLRDDVVCKPSNWNMATITYPYWRRNLLAYMLEWRVYQRVVDRWNARSETARVALADYFRYIERCYEGIDAVQTAMIDSDFQQIVVHSRDAKPGAAESEALERYLDAVDSVCGAA